MYEVGDLKNCRIIPETESDGRRVAFPVRLQDCVVGTDCGIEKLSIAVLPTSVFPDGGRDKVRGFPPR